MKKTKTIEINACDFCDSGENCYHKCLGCGRDVCYDCEKTQGVTYTHALHCSGSGDGWYCMECDFKDKSELHNAYRLMRSIQASSRRFNEETRERADACEDRIRELRETAASRA